MTTPTDRLDKAFTAIQTVAREADLTDMEAEWLEEADLKIRAVASCLDEHGQGPDRADSGSSGNDTPRTITFPDDRTVPKEDYYEP